MTTSGWFRNAASWPLLSSPPEHVRGEGGERRGGQVRGGKRGNRRHSKQ